MSDSGISFSGIMLRSDSPASSMSSVNHHSHHPPVPIDKAACISLVSSALADAREKCGTTPEQGMRPGVTINLSHQRIANIPAEVLEMIKDEIERLALAHNQLTSFSDEFALLPRLRYLNLRSNFLKEFPPALTRLPSLEILDVSRNRIRSLPPSFGKLVSLKVLSMSKNRISVLPAYIGDMNELKILKLDHNPIVFPPKDVLVENEDADRDAWLENVKRFLKQHAEKNSAHDTESGSSSDETGDYSSRTTTLVRKPSTDSLSTIKPTKPPASSPTITPIRDAPKKTLPRRPQHLPTPLSSSSSPLRSPGLPLTPLSATERSRSNSESLLSNRVSRRMGMVGSRPPEPLRTVDEIQKPVKHTRGYSHDSAVPRTRSPTERPQASPYFRRLSSLPEHARSSASSARVGEAARGILYAVSTLQGPIEEYVQGVQEPGRLEIALYNGGIHIGALVGALEAYEERDDDDAVDAVIDACCGCVAAFKQVLTMLRGSQGGQEARYVRTLLLMVYGSYIELQSSYEVLRPLLGGEVAKARGGKIAVVPQTPKYQDAFVVPATPGLAAGSMDGGFDTDEPLFGKFQAATNAAIGTLPGIEREIKAAVAQNLQPSTTFKLREVATLCVSGTDAARRLGKIKWDAIQEGDMAERRKFWEDTNKFTNLVINIAELIKSITQEYVFPKHILVAVGTVVRPTKDLYILMNGSAFRHMAEQQAPPVQQQHSGFAQLATPLSAALGIATMATVPQGYFAGVGAGGAVPGGSRSATLLSQAHPTMTSAVGEVGMAFKGLPVKLS